MQRAYSYVRFSTPEQAKGDSFRRQTEFSAKYAEKRGLTLDDSLRLQDLGVSAFRGSNVKEGALAGFLAAIKAGKVPQGSILIVESLDRLSRDQIRPALKLFMEILDSGVSIVTIKPEREYTHDDQDPLTLIEPLIYFSRAHEESSTKSSRLADSWDARRRSATSEKIPMTTVCPAWLKRDGGKFAEIPDRAEIVRRIFRLCREGMGTYAIAKLLTEEGVKSFGKSGKWTTAYVRLILTDRRAMGEYQAKKHPRGSKGENIGLPIKGYFPSVVSEEDFYVAAGHIKSRKKRGGRGGVDGENLFSGLVFNAADKSKMYYATDKSGRGFLDSTSGYYGKDAPRGRSFRYKPLETAVLHVLHELRASDLAECEAAAVTADQIAETAGRLEEVNGKLEKATEKARTAADFDVYLELIAALKADQKILAAKLEDLKTRAAAGQAESIGEVRSVIQMRDKASGEALVKLNRKLRAMVRGLVSEIWVLVEPVTRVKKVAHVQVFLLSGESRYRKVYCPDLKPDEAPPSRTSYRDVDLRKLVESTPTNR